MKSRGDGQIFDDDTLWDELNGADGERHQAALQTLDAVGELAALRAAADSNLSFNDAWQEVFDIGAGGSRGGPTSATGARKSGP